MKNNKLVPIYEPTLMQLIINRLQMKYDPSVLRHIRRNTFGFDTMVMYDTLRRLNRKDEQGG